MDVYSLRVEESGAWSKMYSVGPIKPIESNSRYLNLSQGFKYSVDEIVYYEYGIFSYYHNRTNKSSRIPGRRTVLDIRLVWFSFKG